MTLLTGCLWANFNPKGIDPVATGLPRVALRYPLSPDALFALIRADRLLARRTLTSRRAVVEVRRVQEL